MKLTHISYEINGVSSRKSFAGGRNAELVFGQRQLLLRVE